MTARGAPSASTRDRILDAAERLFLEKGFRGASLRALSSEAAVNLAAVGYHFGSKEELLRAVLERRIAPVNRERLRRLDAIEASWQRGAARAVEPVLAALLEPAFDSLRGGAGSHDIATLLYNEPSGEMRSHVESLFGDCSRRFLAAFGRALGRGRSASLEQSFQIVIGAMIHFLAGRHLLAPAAGAPLDPTDRDLVGALIAFLAAGLRAEPARAARTRARRRAAHGLEISR